MVWGEKNKKIIIGMLVIMLTFIIVMSYFHLWGTDIRVPLTGYRSDSVGVLLEATNYVRGGSYYNNVLTGAPYVNQGNSMGEIRDSSVPMLLIIPLAKLLGSVEAAVNIHAVLNILLLSISMYMCCIMLKIRPELAAIVALIYSSLPYFVFYTHTLLLIYSYVFYIPFVCLLLIKLMKGFEKEEITPKKEIQYISAIYSLMLYVGINSAYYAFFVIVLLICAFLYVLFHNRDILAILIIATSMVGIVMGILSYTMAGILKSRVYQSQFSECTYYLLYFLLVLFVEGLVILGVRKAYRILTVKKLYILLVVVTILTVSVLVCFKKYTGYFGEWAGRTLYGVELGSTKLYNIFLPTPNNVNDAINNMLEVILNVKNADFGIMGIFTGIGFLYSLYSLLPLSDRGKEHYQIVWACGFFNLVIMLISVKGGFSAIIAALVTTGIRGYNRMCVFVGIFSLVSFALFAQGILGYCQKVLKNTVCRKMSVVVIWCVLISVLLISFPKNFIYHNYFGLVEYNQRKEEYDDWKQLIGEIENVMSDGDMIFELPIEIEGNYFGELMTEGRAYELTIPAIVSRKTTWGNGGISAIATEQVEQLLGEVTELGFDGIYVDKLLYADDSYVMLLDALQEKLGEPIVCNKDRRYFFKLQER